MKKILILSMTCGEGHNAVALSLESQLSSMGAQTKIVQIYGYDEKEVMRQNNMFLLVYTTVPSIYSYIWNVQRTRDPEKRYKNVMQSSLKKATLYVYDQINEFEPDAIVCVHFYAGAIVNNLKRDGLLKSSIYTSSILTDYCVHPFWESNYLLDHVFTPIEYTHSTLQEKGFKPSQLICTGFPINQKFNQQIPKQEARKNLDLKPESFVAMIVSGGYCLANPIPIIKELKDNKNIEMLVVCGKNQKRYKQAKLFVETNNIQNVKVIGFATNINEMMLASDCIISRGGASFTTESLQSELPIIFREKCITNEKLNAELLTKFGCSLYINKPNEIKEKVAYVMNPENANKMKQAIREIKKPNALNDICNYIFNKGVNNDNPKA